MSENWKLCQPLTNSTHVEELQAFLEDVYGTIAMVNYPYETNFIVPLPPNPVKVRRDIYGSDYDNDLIKNIRRRLILWILIFVCIFFSGFLQSFIK